MNNRILPIALTFVATFLALGSSTTVADDTPSQPGTEPKQLVRVTGLEVTPRTVGPNDSVTVSATIINPSDRAVEIVITTVAQNKRFELVEGPEIPRATLLPPGQSVAYRAVIRFQSPGATRVGVAAVGAAGFAEPETAVVVVEDGRERVIVFGVTVLAALAAATTIFLSLRIGRRRWGSRVVACTGPVESTVLLVGGGGVTVLLSGWLRAEALAYRPTDTTKLGASVVATIAVAALLATPGGGRRLAVSRLMVVVAAWSSSWIIFPILQNAPKSAAMFEGLVLVSAGAATLSYPRLARWLPDEPLFRGAVGMSVVLGAAWWTQTVVLRLLYGPDFIVT